MATVKTVKADTNALLNDLEAYWSLDEASGSRADSTANAHTLTDNNTVLAATGVINDGADFESANSEYLSRANASLGNLSPGDQDFSISCWIKLESTGTEMEIMGVWEPTGNQREWMVRITTGAVPRFIVSSDGAGGGSLTFVDWGSALSTGVWYHVVAYHDAVNNLLGIVVNAGTPVTAAFSGGPFQGTGDFTVGRRGNGAYFDGVIDEAGFWTRVLSSTDRSALYNSGSGRAYAALDSFDFSSLVAWEDFASGEANADQHAACYGGGSLGPVTFGAWTSTPSASVYPRVYAATGEEGDKYDPTSGAHLILGDSEVGFDSFSNPLDYLRIEDIAFDGESTASVAMNLVGTGLLVDSCFLLHTLTGGINLAPLDRDADLTVLNTIVSGSGGIAVTAVESDGGTYTVALDVINATSNAQATGLAATGEVTGGGNLTVNCNAKNVIAMLNTTDFDTAIVAGAPTINMTLTNCLSDDGTADDFSGSGNLVDQTATDVHTAPGTRDWTLKAGSAAIDAGTDTSGDGVTVDIVGIARPQGAAYDIGAWESESSFIDNTTPILRHIMAGMY